MPTVQRSIDVAVAASVAYEQWAQFESFPLFAPSIKSVTRLDNTHLRWVAGIGSATARWDAEITEQLPGRLISWRSTSGATNRGVVRFSSLGENRTRVELTVDYEVRGGWAKAGAALGMDDRLAETLLKGFKRFVESRDALGIR